jgi:hypothetical protein
MGAFATLGESTNAVLTREDMQGINMTFVAKKVFVKGDLVQIDVNGDADTVSDVRKAIGVVKVGNSAIDENITVIARCQVEMLAQANGAITAGDSLKYDFTASAADGIATYAPAATTNIANAIALESISDDAIGKVAVFYSSWVEA